MRVLLVDDETEFVSTLAERLCMRGVGADWVSTPEDALEAVANTTYEIAVLDVKIPRMSGLDLKKRIERVSPTTRFIFVTGHGSEADYQTGAAEAGAAFYLVKPVQIGALIAKMKELLAAEKDTP